MEVLFNHHEICVLIYTGNHSGTLKVFEEKFDHLTQAYPLAQCKLALTALNFSIYNYIFMKEKVSLHQCCLKNNDLIQAALDLATLKISGMQLIHNYATCSDYCFEKFSHPEIKKAIQYMHAHMDDPLTLASVCDAIHLNKCYFCTLFKQDTGMTFTQYLNHMRVQAAKNLIKETSLSLQTIAFRCGFSTYSYFCSTFKKFTGYSPSQFN